MRGLLGRKESVIWTHVLGCSGRDLNPGYRLERPRYLTGLSAPEGVFLRRILPELNTEALSCPL